MPARGIGKAYQGMNWIRKEKRYRLYARDGFRCLWCGAGVEAKLTLDHILPWNQGGDNQERNLVTACRRCNSSRGERTVEQFAAVVAAYLDHGVTAKHILRRVLKNS